MNILCIVKIRVHGVFQASRNTKCMVAIVHNNRNGCDKHTEY